MKLTVFAVTALLSAAMLFTGCERDGRETDTTVDNNTPLLVCSHEHRSVEFITGTPDEEQYLFDGSNSVLHHHGYDFRLTDAHMSCVYRFEGIRGQKAYVLLRIAHDYKIELSSDNKKYTEVGSSLTGGPGYYERGFDLTRFFERSEEVYMRVSDSIPSDGWGAHLFSVKYTVCEAAGEDGYCSVSADGGWTVTVGGETDEYSAGEAVTAEPGTGVVFERDVNIVQWRCCMEQAIAFSDITGSVSDIKVSFDGTTAQPVYGINGAGTYLLPAVPETAPTVRVRIETVVPEDGVCGIWSGVRVGAAGLIKYPPVERKLGSRTAYVSGNYGDCDTVELNALAGNYLSSLYNAELGLNNFDTGMEFRQLYYVHDSARSLIALADEERWSPVVRLDYILGLYRGVKAAMVPTSTFDIFLKYDPRPKRVVPYAADAQKLVWNNEQDAVEPVATTSVSFDGAKKSLSVTDTGDFKAGVSNVSRTWSDGERSVTADINWYNGTSDRATTMKLTPSGTDRFSVTVSDFGRFGNISLDPERVAATASGGAEELKLNGSRSFFLHGDKIWQIFGVMVTFDADPESVTMTRDGGVFTSVTLTFSGVSPTVTVLGIGGTDTDLEYPFYVAGHLEKDMTFGTGGYDPSYVCGGEALGTAAFAAAAYIMDKYGIEGADEAEALAVKASDDAYDACRLRRYIPSFQYDRVAACDYLCRLGHDRFAAVAEYWCESILRDQNPDGTFLWFDTRSPNTLARMYLLTGNQKYMDAAQRYYDSYSIKDNVVTYKSQPYTQFSFYGAGELAFMGINGIDYLDTVRAVNGKAITDSGIFDCSDLNPYFLGLSLSGLIGERFDNDSLKTVLHIGEYCMYHADGSYTVSDRPTVYVNNPYQK